MKRIHKAWLALLALVFVISFGMFSSASVLAASSTSQADSLETTTLGSIKAVYNSKTATLTLSGTGKLSKSNGKKLDIYKDTAKKVVIEEGITAVYGLGCSWTKLTSVTLPKSLKALGTCGQDGNSTITGSTSFSYCTNLKTVKGGENVTVVGASEGMGGYDHAFSYSKWENTGRKKGYLALGKVLYIYTKSGKKVTGNYTQVLLYAFSGNKTVQSVKLSGIKYLGGGVFRNCTALRSVELSGSFTNIPYMAFSGCKNLRNISMPSSVTSLIYYSFMGCQKLSSITLPSKLTYIGYETFVNCSSLKSLTIPKNVTTICAHAYGYKMNTSTDTYSRYSNVTICGAAGSEAQRYAKANGITFKKIK